MIYPKVLPPNLFVVVHKKTLKRLIIVKIESKRSIKALFYRGKVISLHLEKSTENFKNTMYNVLSNDMEG